MGVEQGLLALVGAADFGGAYEIEQSLRFDGSSHLNRTPSSAGSTTTWTWSGWLKVSPSGEQTVFSAVKGSGYTAMFYNVGGESHLKLAQYVHPTNEFAKSTTARHRDPSAWKHLVVVCDTTNSTVDDRIRYYVNGEQVTAFSDDGSSITNVNPGSSQATGINTTSAQRIGSQFDGTYAYLNGYMAEVHFLDGTAVTDALDFGEYDDNGVWRPIQVSGVTYGTNGYYLTFDPTATNGIGHDHSGNGNNWTATGFTTSGTGTDVMSDTPTTNWCTLNSAANSPGTRTLSNGNLQAYLTAAGGAKAVGTILIPISGKWYWEMTVNDSNSNQDTGVIQADSNFQIRDNTKFACYFPNGEYKIETAAQTSGFSTYTNGDIISIAVDADTNPPEIYFAKNNTWQNSAAPASSTNGLDLTVGKRYLPLLSHGSSGSSSSGIFNFGQRAFEYTPPTGYNALNTANLPAPDIADGSDYFNTVIYQGASPSDKAVTGVGFQPDFTWIKARAQAYSHALYDAVRGATKELHSDTTDQEDTDTNGLKSFDSDGFTVGSDGEVGDPTGTRVAWNWLAGGSGSSNTDGTITSTVSANPSAGFSIVTYTGTGSAATVGHGLGVPPAFMVLKCRNKAFGWTIYHQSLGNTRHLEFAATTGYTGDAWNSTNPTSTVFSIGTDAGSNNGSSPPNNYVAYCFAEVEGYSKFGSYVSNNSADGPYIFCGFKPELVWLKKTSGSSNWFMYDAARNEYNVTGNKLYADSSAAENGEDGGSTTSNTIDILSNGFKLRTNNGTNNGGDYIFCAWAQHPFGGSGVSPATAR